MRFDNVVPITKHREKETRTKEVDWLNAGKKGRVYNRGGRLWVDFYYLGERVREPSGLKDTEESRVFLRKKLDLILAEIENHEFEFAKRFPQSSRRDHFTVLEGRIVRKDPNEVLFGDYVQTWAEEMGPGMRHSQIRDYNSILTTHLIPYFGHLPFSEICTKVQIKKFVASLVGKKTKAGKPLSAKRIRNIMIPLRIIVRDALEEYDWRDLPDPFSKLELPKVRKLRVHPFTYEEWTTLRACFLRWYQPYFEFAVQTGLRPSEQLALKWSAIDSQFVHVELSRVGNLEKGDLKTPESIRSLEIRSSMREILSIQESQTSHFQSEYVFLNTEGRPCIRDSLRSIWVRAMRKSGLPSRRMYETRHTFAFWALSKGETPEWVARTLGHVDTTMVYRTYSRYIPNLTRRDGTALEELFVGFCDTKGNPDGHNLSHNRQNLDCLE